MNAYDQVASFSKLTVSADLAENANKRRQRFHAVAFWQTENWSMEVCHE